MFVRNGRFYFRKTLPADVQRLTSRTEVWRSLRTDSPEIALRRLPFIVAQVEADIEMARYQAGLTVDDALLRPFSDDSGRRVRNSQGLDVVPVTSDAQRPTSTLTLGAAYQRYLDDPTHSWTQSTRQAYETTRAVVIAAIGDDKPIAALSRLDVRELLEVLRFLPRNSSKHFPRLALREAAKRAGADDTITRISTANANAYLGNFSSFLNWAVGEEIIHRNPARGLRLRDEVARRDKRHPFSPTQLKLIFHAPLYTGCADGERGWDSQGTQRPRNARFWVPLIALHTGMRLNEICQLDVTDIRVIEEIACICITRTSLVGSTDKKLKTNVSERIVPLHRRLIDLGLVRYAEGLLREGQTKLFHDVDRGSKGVRAVAFSKWFTRFLRRSGASQERTSFHSFRHNFRDELRIGRVEHELAMSLGGWVGGKSLASAVSESYGYGHRVAALHDAISQLHFFDIDLSHLAR
ncbi:site-specific integrase [Sphingomonas piscis]|uniref:Site-specific integrase n=1 Tax=Sphingomonas piscis TaxID=2714943 RepID=A0A6G7YNR5_9SPHN|nr:site-specific integrase [Sphingomonas piscis]QIK78382.1 site-specific integrase [Sphingomonas piscis]